MLMSELVHLCIAAGLQDSSPDNLFWLINSVVMSHNHYVDQHSDGIGMQCTSAIHLDCFCCKVRRSLRVAHAIQKLGPAQPQQQKTHDSLDMCRLSSDLFPWGDSGKYKLEELPDLPEIVTVLAEVGALARLYKQRLTAHPSEFVKMAAQKEDIVSRSIWDLELHSKASQDPQVAFLSVLLG